MQIEQGKEKQIRTRGAREIDPVVDEQSIFLANSGKHYRKVTPRRLEGKYLSFGFDPSLTLEPRHCWPRIAKVRILL